jgi:hypothetical protein
MKKISIQTALFIMSSTNPKTVVSLRYWLSCINVLVKKIKIKIKIKEKNTS